MRRALLAVLVFAGPATAESEVDDWPKPPEPGAVQRVVARLDGDTARFSVRYSLYSNDGGIAPSGHVGYDLPRDGVVAAATISDGGKRIPLALVDSELATADFTALHDRAPGRSAKRAALIEAHELDGQFSVGVALPKHTTLIIDTEITAPTCYYRDARYVVVPADWKPHVSPSLIATKIDAEALSLHCDAHGFDEATWIKFPARELAARKSGSPRVGTHAGRVSLDTETQVMKFELNVAARVSEIPADLATAIVIDASRSMTPESIEAQQQTVEAYLRATPNGRVQLIAYSRHARTLLPSWMDTKTATPHIARELQALQFANGSSVEDGLREAGKWLDKIKGTRRVLLVTDENLSLRTERDIGDAIPPRTLVHVVALGGHGFERDDAAKLARIAERTNGLSVRGGAQPDDAKLDATLLARPITLDNVSVDAPGWNELDGKGFACTDSSDVDTQAIAEGEACTWWGITGGGPVGLLTVEGFLWGERIQRVVRADFQRSVEIARELSMLRTLEADLQELAKRAARAVNSVWSLYATWGGDDGYPEQASIGVGRFGSTCGSHCRGGMFGRGIGVGIGHPAPNLEITFERIVKTACKPTHAIDLAVETTFEEIVDVEAHTASPALRECVEAALWSAWLVMPGAPSHNVARLHFDPAVL